MWSDTPNGNNGHDPTCPCCAGRGWLPVHIIGVVRADDGEGSKEFSVLLGIGIEMPNDLAVAGQMVNQVGADFWANPAACLTAAGFEFEPGDKPEPGEMVDWDLGVIFVGEDYGIEDELPEAA